MLVTNYYADDSTLHRLRQNVERRLPCQYSVRDGGFGATGEPQYIDAHMTGLAATALAPHAQLRGVGGWPSGAAVRVIHRPHGVESA